MRKLLEQKSKLLIGDADPERGKMCGGDVIAFGMSWSFEEQHLARARGAWARTSAVSCTQKPSTIRFLLDFSYGDSLGAQLPAGLNTLEQVGRAKTLTESMISACVFLFFFRSVVFFSFFIQACDVIWCVYHMSVCT